MLKLLLLKESTNKKTEVIFGNIHINNIQKKKWQKMNNVKICKCKEIFFFWFFCLKKQPRKITPNDKKTQNTKVFT